jgi:uncharacterized protein (DUF1330 family)
MPVITQLIYLKDGQEIIFDQFEEIAIPLISKYNGQLLLRVRPDASSIIQSTLEKPYEIHVVEFPSDTDFDNFMKDDERNHFLHLKEKAIKSSILIKGTRS